MKQKRISTVHLCAKRFMAILLAIIISVSSVPITEVFAATMSFTINGNSYSYYDGQYVGPHIPYSDSDCSCAALGSKGHYCCYNNANSIYATYWGSGHSGVSENFIYSRPMSECVNNAENMKKYLSVAEPGAFVCIGNYYNSANHYHNGHSFIFLSADENGAWIINTNGYGDGYNKVEYRTWYNISRADNISSSIYYGYIVCISWPGAASQYEARINQPQSNSPYGVIDSIVGTSTGKINVRGWVFDKDDVNATVAIHVYIGGSSDSGAAGYAYEANSYRPDVGSVYAVGDYHGFELSIPSVLTGEFLVYVYAINAAGGGQNIELGHATVNVSYDDITYTVSFDTNGGGQSPADINVISSHSYGTLPVPQRSGYNFAGWYTAADGGEKITDTSVVSLQADQTLYAHWTEKAVSDVILDSSSIQILKNSTYAISACVLPEDVLNKSLSYCSNNTAIAAVSDTGVISAVAPGKAAVTVSAANGVTATIDVEVVVYESEIFSDWTEKLPEGITDEHYKIESKTQYMAMPKETTKSTSSSLDGWICSGSHVEYGAWGATQSTTNAVSNSDTLNITSTSVTYHWYHYCNRYSDGGWGGDSVSCDVNGVVRLHYHPDTDYCLASSNYGDYGNQPQYYDASNPCSCNIYVWYSNGTTTTYYYQTRSATTYYDYYRYVPSGQWQDEKIAQTDATHVQTRTLYRYSHTHTFGQWQTATANSCTTDGSEIRYCTGCSATETRTVSAIGHNYVLSAVELPTCTKDGYRVEECSHCKDRIETVLPTTEHTFSTQWSNNDTQHWHTCENCDATQDIADHIYDDEYDTTCNICGAIRTVETVPDENSFQVKVESKRVAAGQEFTVNVELLNNPGVYYIELTPQYAEGLTLTNATNGTLISDLTRDQQYVWVANSDVTTDDTLMTLTFITEKELTPGEYTVSFTVRGCYNQSEQALPLAVFAGTVEIADFVYGDCNEDGKIDGLDVVRLKKYLAAYNYDTGTSTVAVGLGADCNGDGKIDGLDVVRLKKYLAAYNYDTGTSAVTLGS